MLNFFKKILRPMREPGASEDFDETDRDPPGLTSGLSVIEKSQELGNAALAESQFDTAADYYRQVIAAAPARIDGYLSLGYVLTRLDRFDEAEQTLKQAVSIKSGSADAWYLLATLARDQGKLDEAIGHFEHVIEVNPKFQNAYGELGQLLFQSERWAEALAILRNGIAQFPDSADFHFFLAKVQIAAHKPDDAIGSLQNAMGLRPNDIEIQGVLAHTLMQRNRHAEALNWYRRMTDIKPDAIDSLVAQGRLLFGMGRHEESLQTFDRAIVQAPDNVDALMGRGALLLGFKRDAEAVVTCLHVTRLMPDSAEAHSNLGAALQSVERYQEALESAERALAIRSDSVDALINCATALNSLKRYQEALSFYEKALEIRPGAIDILLGKCTTLFNLKEYEAEVESWPALLQIKPDFVDAYLNHGHALMCLNRHLEALSIFAELVAFNPGYADAHYNESLCRLVTGQFERGWKLYEWRWQNNQFKSFKGSFSQPLWLGKQSLQGKSILLHWEQGLGDTIQFCRYATMVAARGATVYFRVQPELVSLLQGLAGVSRLLTAGERPPPFDYHCPLLSLPLAFETTAQTIPGDVPYLFAATELVSQIHDGLKDDGSLKVGLCWKGGTDYLADAERSPGIAPFKDLISRFGEKHVKFYTLLPDSRALFTGIGGEDMGHEIDCDTPPFAETAALIMNLDLVISCDTSIAHLAGALGKPVWLVLPFSTDWRWIHGRNDSTWYPHTQLIRQSVAGNWRDVFDRVASRLDTLLDDASSKIPAELNEIRSHT